MEEYICSLEEQLDHYESQNEAQDQYIENMEEQLVDLKKEVKQLSTQSKKRDMMQILGFNNQPEEESKVATVKGSSKRIKIDDPPADNNGENKENILQAMIRRSSCIFGFGQTGNVGPRFGDGGSAAAPNTITEVAKGKEQSKDKTHTTSELPSMSPHFGDRI